MHAAGGQLSSGASPRRGRGQYRFVQPPFHPVDEDPTLAIHRDLELMEHLDRIGFDEAWIGEHHSAGTEIIASPEIFIAAAAERTYAESGAYVPFVKLNPVAIDKSNLEKVIADKFVTREALCTAKYRDHCEEAGLL